jgi:hypothetical protein
VIARIGDGRSASFMSSYHRLGSKRGADGTGSPGPGAEDGFRPYRDCDLIDYLCIKSTATGAGGKPRQDTSGVSAALGGDRPGLRRLRNKSCFFVETEVLLLEELHAGLNDIGVVADALILDDFFEGLANPLGRPVGAVGGHGFNDIGYG